MQTTGLSGVGVDSIQFDTSLSQLVLHFPVNRGEIFRCHQSLPYSFLTRDEDDQPVAFLEPANRIDNSFVEMKVLRPQHIPRSGRLVHHTITIKENAASFHHAPLKGIE